MVYCGYVKAARAERFSRKAPLKIYINLKVIPQYCIAHPYCARFRVISTRKLARARTDNERISLKLNSIAK